MERPVLGIDVGKQSLVIVLLVNERSVRGEFANTASGISRLLSWLAKQTDDQVHACLEATGTIRTSRWVT